MHPHTIIQKRYCDKKIAEGLCAKCGSNPINTDRSSKCCTICLDKGREASRRSSAIGEIKDKYNHAKSIRHRTDQRYSILSNARKRAKQKGLPFDITEDDIPVPTFCPVLGIPLMVSNSKRQDNSPTLDRIIPELGYVKGNVMIISFKANRLKSNATPAEIQAVLDYIERYAT